MITSPILTRQTLLALIVLVQATSLSGMSITAESADPLPDPVFHIQERSEAPLMVPDKPWESLSMGAGPVIREKDGRWRTWYNAFDRDYKRDDDAYFCYAESPDGIHWTKPDLGMVEYRGNTHNNIIISGPQNGGCCLSYVFLDDGNTPVEKYKMIFHRFHPEEPGWWVYGGLSADGLHWSFLPEPLSPKNSDTSTPCIHDGGNYRLYTRVWQGGGPFQGARAVGYTESDHFGDFPTPVEIFSHDAGDPEGMQFYSNAATKLAEGLYVMFPAAFYTNEQRVKSHLAWSRDGVHFIRYGREPVVDLGTSFGTKGIYVVPGAVPGDAPNTWWFYYSATNMEHDAKVAEVNYDGGMGRFLLVLE